MTMWTRIKGGPELQLNFLLFASAEIICHKIPSFIFQFVNLKMISLQYSY